MDGRGGPVSRRPVIRNVGSPWRPIPRAISTSSIHPDPTAAAGLVGAWRLARAAFGKYNYNPDEPRDEHGRLTAGGEAAPDLMSVTDRSAVCVERCAYLLERPLPYKWSDINT